VSEISLGVVPNGFVNNFASFWGIEEDEYKCAIDYLIRRRIRKVDVGVCSFINKEKDAEGEEVSRYFVNAVNIGLGASIIGITEKADRLVGVKFFARIFSSVRLVFERISYKVSAEINYEHFEGNITGLCVGNCLGYGQTPNAVPYNGMVDVSIVKLPNDIRQIFLGLYLLISGKFLNYHKVLPFRSREVRIDRADHARISMDGRFLKSGRCPLRIKVLQEHLNFIIPSRS
ncbi:MAG: lipid kinase, partial [Bacteroidaceae bacterium]|nr:lipid kinase [Bacteroidaceae bacterium]